MRLLADKRQVLLAAADVLDVAVEWAEEEWHVELDGKDCYVQGDTYGSWFAYTGNDEGAVWYAEWMTLADPFFGRGLAKVLRAEAKREVLNEETVGLAWVVLRKASSRIVDRVS